MSYLRHYSGIYPEGLRKATKNIRVSVFRAGFEPGTSRIRSRSANYDVCYFTCHTVAKLLRAVGEARAGAKETAALSGNFFLLSSQSSFCSLAQKSAE